MKLSDKKPVRYAEWRPGLEPPPNLRAAFWVEFKRTPLPLRVLLAILATVPITIRLVSNKPLGLAFLLEWMCFMLMALGLSDHEIQRREAREYLPPSEEGALVVSIVLTREGQAYGRDLGILRFEDGRLLFEGRKTMFSFRQSNVEMRNAGAREDIPFWKPAPSRPAGVTLVLPDSGIAIEFTSVVTESRPGKADLPRIAQEHLRRQSREFQALRRGSGEFDVLPPIAPSPDERRREKANQVRLIVVLTCLAVGIAIDVFSPHSSGVELAFSSWILGALICFGIAVLVMVRRKEALVSQTMERFELEASALSGAASVHAHLGAEVPSPDRIRDRLKS
jgi:hypothetical protein